MRGGRFTCRVYRADILLREMSNRPICFSIAFRAAVADTHIFLWFISNEPHLAFITFAPMFGPAPLFRSPLAIFLHRPLLGADSLPIHLLEGALATRKKMRLWTCCSRADGDACRISSYG